MENHTDILREVESFCLKAGIARSTLALRVMNNARFFERLERRGEADAKAVAKLRAYINASSGAVNSASGSSGSAR